MDLYGDDSDGGVRAKMRACIERSFTDITISEWEDSTLVGATWTDEGDTPGAGTGEAYRLTMRTGTRFDGECVILREEDWEDDPGACLFGHEGLTFQEVAEQVSSELAWRKSFAALLDLAACVEEVIEERTKPWVSRLRQRLKEELFADTYRLWSDPALEPPDVEAAFRAFEEACRRRMPYCEGIVLSFWKEDDFTPEVAFGHHPGEDNQILYRLVSDVVGTRMHLNGLETHPDSYEQDIARHHADPWARVGALRAARDLIAIRDAAGALVWEARRAVDAELHQEEMDIQVGVHLGEPGAEEALGLHRRARRDRRTAAFQAVFGRITAFLDQGAVEHAG